MKEDDQADNASPAAAPGRFSELDDLQREIALRIKDNQRFLAGFLAEDYVDEEDDKEDGATDFEEL